MKWITVLVVVIYHVIYMFNGVATNGVTDPFSEVQPQDVFQYIVYHYLGIAVSAWYLRLYVPQMPAVFVYLLVAVSGFAGAFILNEIVIRIPVLRWCVLGIKK